MKKIFYVMMVSVICLAASSCSKKNETDNKEIAEDQNKEAFKDTDLKKDVEFAVEIADAGRFEVMLGQVAAANGMSAEVKKLGQTMVDEHTKANEELKTLAAQKNITMPIALSDSKQKKFDEISSKRGTAFDKAYSEAMVDGHKHVIDAFKKESEKGEDADLKGWAAGKLPTLEHHLSMAEETHNLVKGLKD